MECEVHGAKETDQWCTRTMNGARVTVGVGASLSTPAKLSVRAVYPAPKRVPHARAVALVYSCQSACDTTLQGRCRWRCPSRAYLASSVRRGRCPITTSRPPAHVSSARGPVLMGAPLHIRRVWQWGDTEVVLRALGAARVGCGTYRCAGRLTPGWAGPQVGRQCAGRSARGSVCPDALTLTPSTDHRPRKSSLVAPGAVQVPRRERERVSCLRFLFPFLF